VRQLRQFLRQLRQFVRQLGWNSRVFPRGVRMCALTFGGVWKVALTCALHASGLERHRTAARSHTHVRTPFFNLGVKWSQVQMLSLYCPAESQRPARARSMKRPRLGPASRSPTSSNPQPVRLPQAGMRARRVRRRGRLLVQRAGVLRDRSSAALRRRAGADTV